MTLYQILSSEVANIFNDIKSVLSPTGFFNTFEISLNGSNYLFINILQELTVVLLIIFAFALVWKLTKYISRLFGNLT